MLAVALATTAGFFWLFALPIQLRGRTNNPYIGIIVFILIPIILVVGLLLITLGIFLARRRIEHAVERLTPTDWRAAIRKLAIFFPVMTAINIVIGTQGTDSAVEHMETVQFSGQSCHVMKPEYTAHQNSPHANVLCVDCHVGQAPPVG